MTELSQRRDELERLLTKTWVLQARRSPELRLFAWATKILAMDESARSATLQKYVSIYGRPPFIYGHLIGENVNEDRYIVCNFMYWVSCIFLTYKNNVYNLDDDALFSRACRMGDVLYGIMRKARYKCCDANIGFLLARVSSIAGRVENKICSIVQDDDFFPNMDEVVDIWDFVTHPDVIKWL